MTGVSFTPSCVRQLHLIDTQMKLYKYLTDCLASNLNVFPLMTHLAYNKIPTGHLFSFFTGAAVVTVGKDGRSYCA